MEATGACDAVVDEEWEQLWEEFRKDTSAMKRLYKKFNLIIPVFRKFTKDLSDEVADMNSYFSSHDCPSDLRTSTTACNAAFDKISRAVWPNIEEMWTTTLQPLKKILDEEIPAIKEKARVRAGMLTDVNSYRRKLQKLLSNEKADPERKMVVKGKLDKAVRSYETLDLLLKSRLKKFHADRFELMRPYVEMALFSQLDILGRSAEMLATAIEPLPQTSKKEILQTLALKHSTKGMRPPADGKRNLNASFDIAESEDVSPTVSGVTDVAGKDEEGEEELKPVDPFAEIDNDTPKDVKTDTPTDLAEEWVVADFDFASDDAGDLPFLKGQRIRVLGKEGGWWKGELDGKIGMFPANYTHPNVEDD